MTIAAARSLALRTRPAMSHPPGSVARSRSAGCRTTLACPSIVAAFASSTACSAGLDGHIGLKLYH